MATFETSPSFARQSARLTGAQRRQFRAAVQTFVEALNAGEPVPARLRVRKLNRHRGQDLFEMTWSPKGRALFTFGAPVREGHRHVAWIAVGSHQIFENGRLD